MKNPCQMERSHSKAPAGGNKKLLQLVRGAATGPWFRDWVLGRGGQSPKISSWWVSDLQG